MLSYGEYNLCITEHSVCKVHMEFDAVGLVGVGVVIKTSWFSRQSNAVKTERNWSLLKLRRLCYNLYWLMIGWFKVWDYNAVVSSSKFTQADTQASIFDSESIYEISWRILKSFLAENFCNSSGK